MEKSGDKIIIGFVGGFFALLCILTWVMPDVNYSTSERRELKQKPELSVETLLNGKFMSSFESYSLDQFPFRDAFRCFKAITSLKADNNDVYVVDGVINSMDYPLKDKNLTYATSRFQNVYEMYLKDNNCRVYLSIVPDKNYFYAKANGYLAVDYEKLVSTIVTGNENMTYIDIFPYLSEEDYYRTDTHWKQESLPDVAENILAQMGSEIAPEYETVKMAEDFYGVYYGQAALPMDADKISYLTNDMIKQYKAFDYTLNKEIPVYDESQMTDKDPYELFVGGPTSLVTIDNPTANNDKHLVVFRDSFGSSLAPLLAQGYAKTTLVDIRYMSSAVVGMFVDFKDADVLFIYSTMVLNNSETLK